MAIERLIGMTISLVGFTAPLDIAAQSIASSLFYVTLAVSLASELFSKSVDAEASRNQIPGSGIKNHNSEPD